MTHTRRTIVITIVLSLALALGYAVAQVVSEPSHYTSVILIPKTLGMNRLPECFDPPTCAYQLYRVDPQVKETGWLSADLYGIKNGRSHYATALRVHNANNWIWIIDAEDLFFHRALKIWSTDKAGVVGPFPLAKLMSRSSNVCNQVASKVLVNITNDAGTAYKQPGEAGPIHCRDGSVQPYYTQQVKYGGALPAAWVDRDGGNGLVGTTPRLEPRIDPNWATVPDARTTKNCFNIPIGTACPVGP
jgi:hypothetical protein